MTFLDSTPTEDVVAELTRAGARPVADVLGEVVGPAGADARDFLLRLPGGASPKLSMRQPTSVLTRSLTGWVNQKVA